MKLWFRYSKKKSASSGAGGKNTSSNCQKQTVNKTTTVKKKVEPAFSEGKDVTGENKSTSKHVDELESNSTPESGIDQSSRSQWPKNFNQLFY